MSIKIDSIMFHVKEVVYQSPTAALGDPSIILTSKENNESMLRRSNTERRRGTLLSIHYPDMSLPIFLHCILKGKLVNAELLCTFVKQST
jgi:photosystem II stability/assembly factor-like uncharacterized protein